MAGLITSLTSVAGVVLDQSQEVATLITQKPILLVVFGVMVLGAGVGILQRLLPR